VRPVFLVFEKNPRFLRHLIARGDRMVTPARWRAETTSLPTISMRKADQSQKKAWHGGATGRQHAGLSTQYAL